MSLVSRLGAWGIVACLVLDAASAQEQRLVYGEPDRPLCTLTATVCAGANKPTGVGFVRLQVENLDARPHLAWIEIATVRGNTADVRLPRSVPLGPQERAVVYLPLPRPLGQVRLTFRVDGVEQVSSFPIARGAGLVGLVISDRPDATPAALLRLQSIAWSTTASPEVAACAAAEAPGDWRLYTGFDAVFVDGRARVSTDVQEALRRAAFVGGLLVVAGGEALSAGPLRQLATTASRSGIVAVGLGRVAAIPALDADFSAARAVLASLSELGDGPAPVPETLLLSQPIPGLGQAPVTAFLLVIVLFAAIAGPINFLLLRRWRRPLLALVTVPALGFGTTIVILVYGFVHDGFGVRGVVTSWTYLDQVQHEAGSIVSRTLFAGRAPGALTMGPDTLLLAPRATLRQEGAGDRWHFDSENMRLDGGALPSRTPTPLTTLQQGIARQRLVAQRQGDGLRLASDGGLEVVGDVVLRDLDGAWFGGLAPNLRRLQRHEAVASLQELRERGANLDVEVPAESERRYRGAPPPTAVEARPIGALGERLFDGASLPPGSYVAQVRKAPWLDAHGLSIAIDQERHFVRGRMHTEDFLP